MPVFDYRCTGCKEVFEAINTRPEDDDECPKCGAKAVRIHHSTQHLKKPYYVPPPKATRKFGDSKRTPHKRDRW